MEAECTAVTPLLIKKKHTQQNNTNKYDPSNEKREQIVYMFDLVFGKLHHTLN